MSYLFLYAILIPLVFLVCSQVPKYKWYPFAILCILMIFRFDSVSDYLAYVRMYDDIKMYGYTDAHAEMGWVWLNKLFSYVPKGWFLLMSISSVLPLVCSIKYLKEYNVPIIGSLLIFFLQYYFYFDNILRQCVAISIFMFSLRYFENRKFFRYCITNSFGILLHTSAVVTLVLYPLMLYSQKAEWSKTRIISSIVISYLVFRSAGIIIVNEFAGTFLDAGMDTTYEIFYTGWGWSYLLITIISTLPLLYFKKADRITKSILYMSFFTACITLMLSNIDVLRRLFFYSYIFQIVAISLYLQDLLKRKRRLIVMAVIGVLYISWTQFVYEYFDTSTYKTCFSKNFKESKYYIRGGRLGDQDQPWFQIKDRNHFETFKVYGE